MPYPGWVRRGREPSTPRRALSCLNDIATMSASYLALSCREHVLPLRQQNSLALKKDLIEKISEVFSELPSGWDKFKRPELRAVTGAVFTSIQQQLLAGASGLDVTLLHKALVDLSDKEGDDGSPPIRSPAFQKATQAARVALAAAAPTPAEGFTASAVFGSSHHLERVLLQAAVLPWLQREVWRLIYDLFCLGCLLLLLVAGRASLVNNKGGVMAVRACALISCALLQAWTSSLLTWHSLTNRVSLSL